MENALFFILVTLLGVVVYQDFKSREISWFLIPLLVIGFAVTALFKMHVLDFLSYLGVNITIVAVNLFGVTLLVSLKEKKLTNILKNHLGLGDVLFFIVLTFVFSPINFVFFYLGSVFVITLIYSVIIIFFKGKNHLIPLAGAMSFLLIGILVYAHFSISLNLYQDIILIE